MPPQDDSVFASFPARAYLEKYYSAVGPENVAFLRSITGYVTSRELSCESVIEVAGGPSLFSLLALTAARGAPVPHVTFTDIGRDNLGEVRSWLDDDPDQYAYAEALQWLAGETGASEAKIAADLRASGMTLVEQDWRQPGRPEWSGAFEVVSCHFFAESATADEDELVTFLGRLRDLGRPGATLLTSFITRSGGYRLDGREFPAFDVDRDGVLAYLRRAGVRLEDVEVAEVAAEAPETNPGYDGLLFLAGRFSH